MDTDEWNPVKEEASELFRQAGVAGYPKVSENKADTIKAFWQIVDKIIAKHAVFQGFRAGWQIIKGVRKDPEALDVARGHDIFYYAVRSVFREYARKSKTRGTPKKARITTPTPAAIEISDDSTEDEREETPKPRKAPKRTPPQERTSRTPTPPPAPPQSYIDTQYAVRYQRTVYVGSADWGRLRTSSLAFAQSIQWTHGRLHVPTLRAVRGLLDSNRRAVSWFGLLVRIGDVHRMITGAHYISLDTDAAVALWLDMSYSEGILSPVVMRLPSDCTDTVVTKFFSLFQLLG